MKLTFLLELLFILIIIAFAASIPLNSDSRLRKITKNGLTSKQDATATNEIKPGGGGGGDDDDDDDDDDFSLGEDDDDDDDDEGGEKEKEPQQQENKPEESDEDDDILGIGEDDEDEKDTPSDEDDSEGEEFLLFGDELFGLFTEEEEPTKKDPAPIALASAPLISDQNISPVVQAIPATVQATDIKNRPAEISIPNVVSSSTSPTPIIVIVNETAPSVVVNSLKETSKPLPQLNLAHTPALLELSQTAMIQAETDNSNTIKTSVPDQSSDTLTAGEVLVDNSANIISEAQPASESPVEIIKTGSVIQEANDDSLEEEGMIVVSDATLSQGGNKNSQILQDTDIKQAEPESIVNVGHPLIFHNDKDMEVVEQISHIAVQLSTPAAATTKKPKKKDDEDDGILGIVDSLISDEDEDDDDDIKLESEGDKDEATEDLENAVVEDSDEDEEDEDTEIDDNEIKDGKKKKKKPVGLISSLGQSLGLTRALKSRRKN